MTRSSIVSLISVVGTTIAAAGVVYTLARSFNEMVALVLLAGLLLSEFDSGFKTYRNIRATVFHNVDNLADDLERRRAHQTWLRDAEASRREVRAMMNECGGPDDGGRPPLPPIKNQYQPSYTTRNGERVQILRAFVPSEWAQIESDRALHSAYRRQPFYSY